jgi:hypothetical protein
MTAKRNEKGNMKMTAKTINAMIKEAHSSGRYVYAKTPRSIVTTAMQRITQARGLRGIVQVKVLSDGKWAELVDGFVTVN